MNNNESDQTSSVNQLSDGRSLSQLQLKCSHTWTIKNFSFCLKKNGDSLRSPLFSDKPDSKLKWRLRLYPKGRNEQARDFVSVFLYLNSSDIKPVTANFTLLLLNSNKTIVRNNSFKYLFKFVTHGSGCLKWLRRNTLLSKINGLFPDDELTIRCEINATLLSAFVSNPEDPFVVNQKEFSLAKTLASLLETENFSDVTLIKQDKKFRAHKAILAANSEVFAAMFKQDMKEKDTYFVDIEDLDSEAVEIMLRFLYTAETPVLDLKKAKDVLAASEKYSINSLKSICEEYLSSNQTVETAAESLYLADLHNAAVLKRSSLNFILDHADRVFETSFGKFLAKNQLQLCLEVLEKLALH